MLGVALLLLLAVDAHAQHTPQLAQPDYLMQGSLSRYDAGVMERNNEWRHTNGVPGGFNPHGEYDGYLALFDCDDVGKVVTALITIDRVQSGPYRFYVADCTESPYTKRWMLDNRIAGELDYEAWQRFGIVDGRGAWLQIEAVE